MVRARDIFKFGGHILLQELDLQRVLECAQAGQLKTREHIREELNCSGRWLQDFSESLLSVVHSVFPIASAHTSVITTASTAPDTSAVPSPAQALPASGTASASSHMQLTNVEHSAAGYRSLKCPERVTENDSIHGHAPDMGGIQLVLDQGFNITRQLLVFITYLFPYEKEHMDYTKLGQYRYDDAECVMTELRALRKPKD
ncbi:hypothetical protein CERSUDRAFT_76752 [Gelatoporia subvermispora B]|uniref:Uncharacterized protein n=1 Tax=Ceriporiopsis subvermispora (strain B) TaxID=914234 RepID=M2Q882_CERS8|nr:hypothetical protein CERSUDRAFT_76752 [Gelatoporia subvermispora B]